MTENTLLVILGPTASGKTSLSIDLAEKLGTEILSCDSRQFYRELKIGSAMPSEEELGRVPHHFVGHLSVTESYNVSRYETAALEKLQQLFQTHRCVILCGGSGLYLDAVCYGMDELPDPDPDLREGLKKQLEESGLAALQFELKRLDPEYFKTADVRNPARVIRALEVCLTTGKPFSSLRTHTPHPRPFRCLRIGLDWPLPELTARIRARTRQMIEAGLEQEARALYPLRHLNALNTVGYKEMFSFINHQMTLEEAEEKICINTRRYARRQLTWFRRNQSTQWFRPEEQSKILRLLDSGS